MITKSITQRHIVIFDCNVYLDVASRVGPPFTWERFSEEAVSVASENLPLGVDREADAVRAIAICTSGVLAGEERLQVWTCTHVRWLVGQKATQPVGAQDGRQGLGWAEEDARGLVVELVDGLVEQTGGDKLLVRRPHGNPPLDHEDGMVWAACKALASRNPDARAYCVTSDRDFIKAYRDRALGGYAHVLSPAAFVEFVRRARAPEWRKKFLK